MKTIDPSMCPICAGENHCAMEKTKTSGEPQPACWCVGAVFTPALLAQVPETARGVACICAQCANKFAGPSQQESQQL